MKSGLLVDSSMLASGGGSSLSLEQWALGTLMSGLFWLLLYALCRLTSPSAVDRQPQASRLTSYLRTWSVDFSEMGRKVSGVAAAVLLLAALVCGVALVFR
jgi:hypothetical protein